MKRDQKLKRVGVVRCDMCGGRHVPRGEKRRPCPRCHGDGFVEVDERPSAPIVSFDGNTATSWRINCDNNTSSTTAYVISDR